MSKILFPTDFSETSEKAWPTAKAFAQFLQRSIEVAHYFHPVTTDVSGVDYNLAKELQELKDEQMKNYMESLDTSGVNVTSSVQVGFPIQSMVERSKEEETSLIVMSTQGERHALDRWLGSVSSELSVKARCPVILVPEGKHSMTFKNVLYATSHESLNDQSIRRLQNLIQQLGAAIHFLYVAPKDADRDALSKQLLDTLFADGEPNFSFSVEILNSDDIISGINGYVKENQIDLTIMYNVSRSWWKSLVHKSTSKRMAFNTETPLLVMHQDDMHVESE
jgi:nucleotide-binding universal stress UspA family protein